MREDGKNQGEEGTVKNSIFWASQDGYTDDFIAVVCNTCTRSSQSTNHPG